MEERKIDTAFNLLDLLFRLAQHYLPGLCCQSVQSTESTITFDDLIEKWQKHAEKHFWQNHFSPYDWAETALRQRVDRHGAFQEYVQHFCSMQPAGWIEAMAVQHIQQGRLFRAVRTWIEAVQVQTRPTPAEHQAEMEQLTDEACMPACVRMC